MPTTTLDPHRTLAELDELRALTGDAHGAQRVAWTDTWLQARAWFRAKAQALPVEIHPDAAGNVWTTLRGRSERALILGSHLDSVPNGGWLDGCLGVLAGLEVLRRIAAEGEPPLTVRLVDWADEEGARFGRSLFGSSAAAGALDPAQVRDLTDAAGRRLADVVGEHGVDVDTAHRAQAELEHAAAYLELHIEQGPVLEGLGAPLGVVIGTFGVERHAFTFTGQAAHAGSTPMDQRRDAFAAAAKLGLEIRAIARRHGGVCTMGRVTTRPGIVTAVVGECEAALDQRHLHAPALAAMWAEARAAAERFAAEERVAVAWRRLSQIEPAPFHPQLIELGAAAIQETVGVCHRLPSGPLHDASAVARRGVPTVMLFAQSLRGLSHTREEDTRAEHLAQAVTALDKLASKTLAWLTGA